MDGFRSVLHRLSTGTEASIQWDVGVSKTALNPSMSTKTAIVSSLARAVFAFCQQAMVSMKEGDCDSQEEEEEEEVDVVEETGVGADEASLHRLGGFALYALIKAHQKSANPDVLSILKSIRMPLDAKAVDLPSNIQHLDKGGMTFMKKEMLGYLAMVCVGTLLEKLYMKHACFMYTTAYFMHGDPCMFHVFPILYTMHVSCFMHETCMEHVRISDAFHS